MIPAINNQTMPYQTQTSSMSLNWNWLEDLQINEEQGMGSVISIAIRSVRLENSPLSCCLATNAGAWENRLVYIKKVVEDLVNGCPKDEELTLVSMGSGNLLMEYLIGKALILNNFQKISFCLIDPTYLFDVQNKEYTQLLLKEFRDRMGADYSAKWNEPLPQERIRYLSRAKNIGKYFLEHSNVVLLESLPPYGQIKNSMSKYNLPNLEPEDFFMGNLFVSPENANAIAFLPKGLKQPYLNYGVTLKDSLPLVVFKNPKTESNYCVDWGCKIYPNGNFFLNFFGGSDYFQTFNLDEKKIRLPDGKEVYSNELIPALKEMIEVSLQQKINLLKGSNPDKALSQSEITGLLTFVKEEFCKLNLCSESFFIIDYVMDQSELVSFLAAKAGHHYRKAFSLVADPSTIYRIGESTLM